MKHSRHLRMALASTASSAADLATLLLLALLMHLGPGVAATVGCIVGGLVNFTLSRHWVFAARNRDVLGQVARYAILVVALGSIMAGAIVHLATEWLSLPLLLAKAVAAATVLVAWNYPVNVHVVFKQERAL